MSEVLVTVREALSPENYHTPEPLPPSEDPRAKGLKWPGQVAAAGLIIWAFVGYGISGLGLLPRSWLDFLTLLGAAALAVGSEAGTLAAIAETFRKHGNEQARPWDWAAIVVSQMTTIIAVLVAWSRLRQETAGWTAFVVDWGPMALAIFASMDIYFGHMEFGLYCSQFDKRHREWEDNYFAWCEREAVSQGWSVGKTSGSVSSTQLPAGTLFDESGTAIMPVSSSDNGTGLARATINDWRALVPSLEWDPATVPLTISQGRQLLLSNGYGLPSESTLHRWVREANENGSN